MMRSDAHVSRRVFFKGAAVAGAAVVASPYLIPSGVLAAPGRPGANDRIGVAGIGIGRQGTGLVQRAAANSNVRFIGIADVNLPRAVTTATKLGGIGVQDYHKILERKDVDAIITATPEHWRAIVCIEACQAGKDIYAEKPVSLTIREGRLMVQAARKYHRVFQVGSQQRSQAINCAGAKWIREGGLGKIRKIIVMNYPSPFNCGLPEEPVPAGLDWDVWCGPTEPVPYHSQLYVPRGKPGWLSFRPYSGGEMTGWGSHAFDQVQSALGMDETGPVEVWVEGPQFDPPTITKPESNKRPNAICSQPKVFFRYANGIVMEPGNSPSFGAVFIGEKGRLTIDRGKLLSDPATFAAEAGHGAPATESHIENWIDCMKSRAKPNADIEIGHRSATVCHLGNIARWTNRRLRWDPVKEVFPDDAEANTYLDRKRRKPYELPTV
ncbi:MAG: Gfo/Idh/MocA family oxidoreductase [Thermoguttaceae bacterium]